MVERGLDPEVRRSSVVADPTGGPVAGDEAAVALSAAEIEALAARLDAAERTRTPIARLTDERPGLSLADAYAVQAALLARRRRRGETIVGAKLGFTSLAMRRALGVEVPNFGWLTDAMLLDGPAVPLGQLIHPKVEPEIAFLLGRDLRGPGVTVVGVLAATTAVVLCLEIVDSRYEGFRFRAADNVADDSSAARLVLGGRLGDPRRLDLSALGVVLSVDGRLSATATGAAAEGHPATAVAWLANRLAADARGLRAGDLVIAGGLTAPVDLRPGTLVTAEAGGLGSVSCYGEEAA
jgi:2-oxo-3-hexenedioate decarboxylase